MTLINTGGNQYTVCKCPVELHTTPLQSILLISIEILDTIFFISSYNIHCLTKNEVFCKLPCMQCKTTLLPSTAKLKNLVMHHGLVCRYV